MKQKLKNKFLLLAVALFVTACVGDFFPQAPTHKLEPVVRAVSSYKRLVEVYSPDSTLLNVVKQAIAGTESIVVTEEAGAGEFRLSFNKELVLSKKQPRLVGMLTSATVEDSYKISYSLTTSTGEVLSEGVVKAKSAPRDVILPNASIPAQLDIPTARLAATQAVLQITPHINALPWRARITSVIDTSHVAISAGDNIGLKIYDVLITETHPVAKLEVALFEKLPNNQQRTVLRLVEGELPKAGRSVISVRDGLSK